MHLPYFSSHHCDAGGSTSTSVTRSPRTIHIVLLPFVLVILCIMSSNSLPHSSQHDQATTMPSLLSVSATSLSILSTSTPSFSACSHPLTTASSYFSRDCYPEQHALPTNRWWMNSVLEEGEEPVEQYPYSVRVVSERAQTYRDSMTSQKAQSQQQADPDMHLSMQGIYISLPLKETSEIQVITGWRPNIFLTSTTHAVGSVTPESEQKNDLMERRRQQKHNTSEEHNPFPKYIDDPPIGWSSSSSTGAQQSNDTTTIQPIAPTPIPELQPGPVVIPSQQQQQQQPPVPTPTPVVPTPVPTPAGPTTITGRMHRVKPLSSDGSSSESQADATVAESIFHTHQVIHDDLLSVRMEWKRKDGRQWKWRVMHNESVNVLQQHDESHPLPSPLTHFTVGRMVFPLVRGSPYITGIYSGSISPALFTAHAILSVNENQRPIVEGGKEECDVKSALDRHHIVLNSGHTVLAYLDRKACVKWDRNRVVFVPVQTGETQPQGDWIIRVAMLPALDINTLRTSVGILDAFRSSLPLSGEVSFEPAEGDESSSVMRMAWKSVDVSQNSITLSSSSSSNNPRHPFLIRARSTSSGDAAPSPGRFPCQFLLLSLPHQSSFLLSSQQASQPVDFHYDSIKGMMQGQVGSVWLIRLKHHTSLNKPLWSAPHTIGQATNEWQDMIRASLHRDSHMNISVYATDPYGFGKELAKLARLVLIADELEEKEIALSLRNKMKHALLPWLTGTNSDTLYYDTHYGGLLPKNGLADRNADFGSSWYNDHHFHYGYFIYSAAVLIKEDVEFGREWRDHLMTFVRDIANPQELVKGERKRGEELDLGKSQQNGAANDDHSSSTSLDSYFTSLRHIDFYEGHSWANGFFSSPNGRNQESSTEAINAYYAIELLGHALGEKSLAYLGAVLTATEIRGAEWYWHMSSSSPVYSSPFKEGKCVGMVWSSKIVQQTWFAAGRVYVHGINILPVTPITEFVLDKEWVTEEYPVLEASIPSSSPPVDDVWLGFVYADYAVLNPQEAWKKMMKLQKFDGGASLTNFLWWTATRPQ